MSDPKDKDSKEQPPGSKPAVATGADKRSGRISYDARGNSVWEWQLETGVYSRDITTQKLKKLDLDELSIAETGANKPPPGLGESQPELPSGGFNPYDNSKSAGGGSNPYDNSKKTGGGGSNPYDNARSLGKSLDPSKAAPPEPRKPADLQKLEEWMKIKKRVQDAKDDDDDK